MSEVKIKITRPTVCDGKPVKKDQEITTSEKNAKLLIQLGKAETVEGKKKASSEENTTTDDKKTGKDKAK